MPMKSSLEVVNEASFLLYAARHYDNVCLDDAEFLEDLNRFKYIKKILYRYRENQQQLNVRLLLNHFVVLFNVFGVPVAIKLLAFKLSLYWKELFTILRFFEYLPLEIKGIGSEELTIHPHEYEQDEILFQKLKEEIKSADRTQVNNGPSA